MNAVSIYQGVVVAVKDGRINIKTHGIQTGLIDVFLPISKSKTHKTLIEVGDLVLVLSVGNFTIALPGQFTNKLELDDGVFEHIKYKSGAEVIVKGKELTLNGFDKVSIGSTEVEMGGDTALKSGVVCGIHTCAFTGGPHPVSSKTVKASS